MPTSVNIDIRSISLRHLKAIVRVAEVQNITRAAVTLRRSQTAITKSISEIEGQVGVKLFDRTSKGVTPTTQGDILVRRTRSALAAFQVAANIFLQMKGGNVNVITNPVFSMDISSKRLMALVALTEHRDVRKASAAIQVTRAAIYNSIRELEALLDIKLFQRKPGNMVPEDFTMILVRQIKLAFSEIHRGLEELENLDGGTVKGKIVIGSLPLARTMLLPRAINHILKDHPDLNIQTREGPYDVLESGLRSGEIDMIIGALRHFDETSDLKTEALFEERLIIVTRKHHPLTKEKNLTINDVLDHQWVLPPKNTPARAVFDDIIQKKALENPDIFIETSSLATLRGLLLGSDRIALISEHQLFYEIQFGMLSALPIELTGTYRPIGITMRSNTTPSPAAYLFYESLRNVADNVQPKVA
ncbi:MAG: LysR family transcriptional regulator [Alphaproteobacteria bacterium]|nr:MAG: LysR family transcriptional regulator [Alphaproteobacteria bacterium]